MGSALGAPEGVGGEKRAQSRLGKVYSSLCGHTQVQMKMLRNHKRSRKAPHKNGGQGDLWSLRQLLKAARS